MLRKVYLCTRSQEVLCLKLSFGRVDPLFGIRAPPNDFLFSHETQRGIGLIDDEVESVLTYYGKSLQDKDKGKVREEKRQEKEG